MRTPLVLLGLMACAPRTIGDARPLYPSCPEVETAPGALAEKAAHFDDVAQRWHMPPGQDLLVGATLSEDLQRFEQVNVMRDNTGLWTSIYAASQAFRFAVTHDREALANTQRALRGERDLMRISGVPGLFARAYVNPKLPGFPSGEELNAGFTDCDLSVRHCKRWIPVSGGDFDGYLWKNDTSKDEYSGHLFALGVIGELIDDEETLAIARSLAGDTARHFIDHRLEIIDFDGKRTTYGDMHAASLGDFPGFNGVLMLSWIRIAAGLTSDPRITAYYQGCLLHQEGVPCETPEIMTTESDAKLLDEMGLDLGCLTNWNNHNMAQLSMFGLIRWEDDPALKSRYREVLDRRMWNAEPARPMSVQGHSLFTFFYEANRGPELPMPEQAIDDAICTLKKYPAEKYHRVVHPTGEYPEVCLDRLGRPMSDRIVPIDQRPIDNYAWRNPPYRPEVGDDDRRVIESPEDYLLAYWLGRYFGIIPPEL